MRHRLAILLSIMLLIGSFGWGCADDADTEKAGQELLDNLTDSLDFEDGVVIEGDPPAGDANGPGITDDRAPDSLRKGASFTFKIYTDAGAPGNAVKAIFDVEDEDGYIEVSGFLYEEDGAKFMSITGQLKNNKLKAGYTVKFALQINGVTGLYETWAINISEETPQVEFSATGVVDPGENGVAISNSPPEGQTGESAPQITSIEGSSEIYAPTDRKGTSNKIFVSFESANYPPGYDNVDKIIITLPGRENYIEWTNFSWNMGEAGVHTYIEIGLKTKVEAGDTLVFMFALMDSVEETVGLYWPFKVEVIAPPTLTDGDEDEEMNAQKDEVTAALDPAVDSEMTIQIISGAPPLWDESETRGARAININYFSMYEFSEEARDGEAPDIHLGKEFELYLDFTINSTDQSDGDVDEEIGRSGISPYDIVEGFMHIDGASTYGLITGFYIYSYERGGNGSASFVFHLNSDDSSLVGDYPLYFGLSANAGGGESGYEDGNMSNYFPIDFKVREPPPLTTYNESVSPIFGANCASCHPNPTEISLEYDSLVYQYSTQSSYEMPLVYPNDTYYSYLWHKLNGTHVESGGGYGDPMPPSGSLSSTDLDTIKNWILTGATESGADTDGDSSVDY